MGPKLQELDRVAKRARSLLVKASLTRPGAGPIRLEVRGSQHSAFAHAIGPSPASIFQRDRSLGAALLHVVKGLGGAGTLDPASVSCEAEKSPVKGDALQDLCQDALCEAFGVEAPSPESRDAERKAERARARQQQAAARARRKELLALLGDGPEGVKQWNARRAEAVELAPFRGAELSGLDLAGAQLVDMPEGQFVGTRLARADLHDLDFTAAAFRDADLREAHLKGARLVRADLGGACLDGADLWAAWLHGTVLRGASLQGARLDGAFFEETTVWPDGFVVPETLQWTGKGPNPAQLAALATRKAREGPIDLQAFMQRLQQKLDRARFAKALGMLKSERFQLFVEVTPERLAGVVKSQSDPDLVYSCTLSAQGTFGCCTQNLNVCGGLRGALCKHLLVLVVGLAQAGEIDADTLDDWVQRSALHKPVLDREAASAILLRYKGAEAGELDWRPTETVPEDFYAY